MRNTLLFFVGIWIAGCASSPTTTEAKKAFVRAAFDVGSGATKMKVGRITRDEAGNTNVEILFPSANDSGEVKVAYKDAMKASGAKREIPTETIELGVAELKKLKAVAEPLGATEFVGVATSAFREAANGNAAAQKLAKDTGINLKVISQEEEASLGFWAAVGVAKVDPTKAVVWDIGGGSQQISVLGIDGTISGANNNYGSDVLKEKIRAIKGNQKKKSINPVGPTAANKGLAVVRGEAKKASAGIKERITRAESIVLGIGSVHSISIRDQAMSPEDKSYDQSMVKKSLEASWSLRDEKIGGKYVENQIPNLILVLGFMEELGITEVTPLKVNLADGLLRQVVKTNEPVTR